MRLSLSLSLSSLSLSLSLFVSSIILFSLILYVHFHSVVHCRFILYLESTVFCTFNSKKYRYRALCGKLRLSLLSLLIISFTCARQILGILRCMRYISLQHALSLLSAICARVLIYYITYLFIQIESCNILCDAFALRRLTYSISIYPCQFNFREEYLSPRVTTYAGIARSLRDIEFAKRRRDSDAAHFCSNFYVTRRHETREILFMKQRACRSGSKEELPM